MKSRLLFFLLIFTTIFACQEDNFDEFTEEALPYEPTEVELSEPLLSYRIQQTEIEFPEGFGVKITNDTTKLSLYAIAADTFQCQADVLGNSLSLSTSGEIGDFFIAFFKFEDGEPFTYNAIVTTVIDNERITVFGSDFINPDCAGDTPFLVNIEEETKDFIRGTYEAEFFKLVPPQDSTADIQGCEIWESVGILNAEFAVPLGTCD